MHRIVKLLILCVNVYAFDPSNRPKCLISGQATEGWNQINSPQYPNPIPGTLQCLYIISAPAGNRIRLEFDDFELLGKGNPNCKKQGLQYLDPKITNVPGVTKTICGNETPKPIISKGNEIYLLLSSTNVNGVEMKGFQIRYTMAAEVKSVEKPKKKGGFGMGGGKKAIKMPKKMKPKMKSRPKPEIRVALENDTPIAMKASKSLGGKTDQNYKALLKWMFIGIGGCAGLIILFMVYRKFTGAKDGIPEPTVVLPEGTLPTHLKAINDYKEKLKAEGKEFVPDSD